MTVSTTELILPGSGPAQASPKLLDSREELLRTVRSQNPDLQAEDAFQVPAWFVQQKAWFHDPVRSDSTIFNYPLLLRLRGPLDEEALQQSLQEIVRRHGVFRSVFRIVDEKLIQIVVAPRQFNLPLIHLDGLHEAREMQMQETARAEAMQPFDLARGPMLRARLMRLEAEEHFLLLTTHTIIYDDWSTGVLIRELSETYGSFAAGTVPLMRPLPFQYGDFIRWQDERLHGPELEAHLDHGREQLESSTVFEHLPADYPRPGSNTHVGARQTVILPAAQADSLKMLCRQERVSLFMVLLAGFKCLLHRSSGHEEIGVASCAANRSLVEVEGLIGRFGNSTLLRTSLAGNPTFGELLGRMREVTLKAWSHQELPFGMLLERFAAETVRNGRLPFQAMFNLQNAPKEKWQLSGLSVDWLPLETGTSKLDLIVWLKLEPTLEISFEYSTQLFKPATIEKLLADYQAILEIMARDPRERVDNVRISAKPRGPGGKPAPVTVKRMTEFGDRASVEAQLLDLWTSAFEDRSLDVTQNFFELSGDSLLASRLFAQINKTFHRSLPLSTLLEAPTIRELAQVLCDEAPCFSSTPLVSVQPNGTRPPLFCVHGHGGEPFYCRELSRSLGPDQPLFGLRSQGHCGQPIQRTVHDMAAEYVKAIRAVLPQGPYYLGGFCFGGMVAYEMARLLAAQNQEVALLALFNTPSPGSLRWWPLNPNFLKMRVLHELKKLPSGIGPKLRVLGTKSARLAGLAFGSFKAAFWSVLNKSSLPCAGPLQQGILSVAEANIAAAKAYRPGNYTGRITLFLTREVATYYAIAPRAGWLPFATGGVECHPVGGDNNSLFDPPFNKDLAERLTRCLELAGDRGRASTPMVR